MNYSDIEKLATVFEKTAFRSLGQQISEEPEGWETITTEMVPVIERELTNKFLSILLNNLRMSGTPGEPPPVPPKVYVAVTRFDEPGTEFTIGLGREIPQNILNRAILELDTWLKCESRYRDNQLMKNATWKTTVVSQPTA